MIRHYAPLIGLRYGGSRRRGAGSLSGSILVSFISRLSMAAMILGVAVLIVVLSLMNGFEAELRQRILGLVPQVSVYQRGGIEDWQALAEQLKDKPEVKAIAPFVEMQGLANRKGQTQPIVVYGIEPEQELTVSVIGDFIAPERLAELSQPADSPKVLIGSALAEKLKLEKGQSFRLVIPAERRGRGAKIKVLRVLDTVHTGTELDQHLILAGLRQAAALSATPERVTGLRLSLSDLDLAPQVRLFLSQELGYSYYVSDWTHTKGNLYHGVKMSKRLVGLILMLIIAIAAFNVVSTLVMVVIEKQGSIAILRTMGASTAGIMTIFVIQGALIGLVGAGFGALLGSGLAVVLPDMVAGLETLLGFQFLQSDVYPISYVPSDLRLEDVLVISLSALSMSLLASLYPAWRAANIGPAKVLRYE
ncbi:lipoprotein-releasing ABC transporter permease subunit [Pseudoteredinibacter isoporae]|uniref:lipoprotein-releasing ABC transporter permease subunit n=1 Tax=Pseudoteredinibacter isoporae TaxID=570281 RepID=UPI00310217D2